METTFIYGIWDRDHWYIGKANDPVSRFQQHIKAAKNGEPWYVCRWLRKLITEGRTPTLEVLMTVPAVWWEQYEIGLISRFRKAGFKVLNMTSGGEGAVGMSAEVIARRSEKQRQSKTSKNTSGVPGVYHNKKTGMYVAYITFKKRRFNLGSYTTLEEAKIVRQAAQNGTDLGTLKPVLRKEYLTNKTGVPGVSYNARDSRFQARIQQNKVSHNLGYFQTLEEAAAARKAAEKNLTKTLKSDTVKL